MNTHTIVLGVVIVVLLYLVYMYFFSNSHTANLVSYHDATQELTVSASSLPSGPTANYTFSIWFFINEWNYRYGQEKIIFQRTDQNNDAAPKVSLDPTTNNLNVSLATYPSSNQPTTSPTTDEFVHLSPSQQEQVRSQTNAAIESALSVGSDTGATSAKLHVCSIESVPIQKMDELNYDIKQPCVRFIFRWKTCQNMHSAWCPQTQPSK